MIPTVIMGVLIKIAIVVAILGVAYFLGVCCYKKAPPNVAMVVTGFGGSKTISGKGCLVIPILQRVDYLSLMNIQCDFTSRDEIPTKDAINVQVDAVANFCVSQDPSLMKLAAAKFLGMNINGIAETVRPVLEGNIREIISQTTLKDLIQGDKKALAEKVIENVTPNLESMGLNLTTFNIQNFHDKNGVINDLGMENIVQISKDASISKAKAEQEIAVARAEAERASNEASVASKTAIAERENALAIRQAELKKIADIKQAEADAAYAIQKEEQRKEQEVATANANLARQEKEIELKEQAVRVTERELEAKIKKQAEAEKYAAQQSADAHLYKTQKAADAELYERKRDAEAACFEQEQNAKAVVLKSEAEKTAVENAAEARKAAAIAEAAAIREKGEAEAKAIEAKALAEAEGIMKRAEAMKQYGEAAREQQTYEMIKYIADKLPDVAAAIGNGYAQVDSIKMFGSDTSQLGNNILGTSSQVVESVMDSLGIDLKSVIAGYVGGKVANDN